MMNKGTEIMATIKKWSPGYFMFLAIFAGVAFPAFMGGFAKESFTLGDLQSGLIAMLLVLFIEPLFVVIAFASGARLVKVLSE
jgi:hypothetical protein